MKSNEDIKKSFFKELEINNKEDQCIVHPDTFCLLLLY